MTPPVQYLVALSESDHVTALANVRNTTGLVVMSYCYWMTSKGPIQSTAIYRDGHFVRGGLTTPDDVAAALAALS